METSQEKRGLRTAWTIVGTLLAVSLLTLVILGVFRIETFQVVGNELYSKERIQNDLIYDFPTGNTLWFSWKYRTATTDARAPYLKSIQAKLVSPSEVRVTVQEKIMMGYVQYNGTNVFFDTDGIVLEMSDREGEGVVLVSGAAMSEPTLYQKLPVENTALLRTILSLTKLIRESELEVDSIEFDENLNITAVLGTVRVDLGQAEYLEEKISNLVAIYPKVASQTGTLNMTAFTGRFEAVTFKAQDAEMSVDSSGVTPVENADTGNAEAGDAGSGTGNDTGEAPAEGVAGGDMIGDTPADTGTAEQAEPEPEPEQDNAGQVGLDAFMVFDSSGTLRYDAHVVNGQVVDKYGNLIDGCYVNEKGTVMDAYWNEIDPMTGTLAES